MKRRQKGEGFAGQRIVVLPRGVLAQARQQLLLRGLLPTDAGYFPRATGHLRERAQGIEQAIFIHCARGEGWCELAGARHVVHPGEVLVVPPGMPHAYGAQAAQPWSIYWFHAQGDLLGNYLHELKIAPSRPVFQLGTNTPFLALFEEILDTMEHGYTAHQLMRAAQTLAHLLAVLISDQENFNQQSSSVALRITQTVDYMKAHLHHPLQLDSLAALANLSRSRYAALFKRQTGFAPIDYFIRLRMHRACQMLDTTDASIKEIATQLGYEDPLYFSRLFRAVNDRAPTDYRKMHKG